MQFSPKKIMPPILSCLTSPLPDYTHASYSLTLHSASVPSVPLCSHPARKNQGSQSPMPHIRLRFSSASAVSVHRSRHAFGVTLPLPDCPEATWTGRSPVLRTFARLSAVLTTRASSRLAQGLRFIEPLATPTSLHSRSSAAYPPESPYSSYSLQAVSRVPHSAKRPLSVPEESYR